MRVDAGAAASGAMPILPDTRGRNAEGVMRGTFKIGQNGAASTMRAGKDPADDACLRKRPRAEAVLRGNLRRRSAARAQEGKSDSGVCGGVRRLRWEKVVLHGFGEGEGRFRVERTGVRRRARGRRAREGTSDGVGGKEKRRGSTAAFGECVPPECMTARKIRAFGEGGGVRGLPEARVFRNTLFSN